MNNAPPAARKGLPEGHFFVALASTTFAPSLSLTSDTNRPTIARATRVYRYMYVYNINDGAFLSNSWDHARRRAN